jgi:hypothetical protein
MSWYHIIWIYHQEVAMPHTPKPPEPPPPVEDETREEKFRRLANLPPTRAGSEAE